MKRILLPIAGLLLSIASLAQVETYSDLTNQHLFDTVPYLRQHHEERLTKFRNTPTTAGTIIFLGNSITEGGAWHKLTGDTNILNRGIGGDITYGLLQRLDEVMRHAPSKLFILIGINDIAKDIPEAVIAHNCERIIRTILREHPGTKIYLQSILPVNPAYPGFPQHYNKAHEVVRTNTLLREVARTTGVRFIDLYPFFCDDQQHLDRTLTSDGLHLNEKGYQRWIEVLKSFKAL